MPLLSAADLQSRIDRLPRVPLAFLPTPLVECPRLSEKLCGPRIWMKRDDLTGLAFGGNKTRMLEFWMAEARNAGADVVITGASLQSNHCRQVAAAANRLGLKTALVLFGKIEGEIQGNLLLDAILGAEIHNVQSGDFSTLRENLYAAQRAYQDRGFKPYVIDGLGPSSVLGAVAYVECALELLPQMQPDGGLSGHTLWFGQHACRIGVGRQSPRVRIEGLRNQRPADGPGNPAFRRKHSESSRPGVGPIRHARSRGDPGG